MLKLTNAIYKRNFYIEKSLYNVMELYKSSSNWYEKTNNSMFSFVVVGNKQKKFIKWLKKISKKIIFWKPTKDWVIRYNKYHDTKRYSSNKLNNVLKYSKTIILTVEFNNEFLTLLKLIKETPLNYFILNWNASKYTITTNLQIDTIFFTSTSNALNIDLEIGEIYERVA